MRCPFRPDTRVWRGHLRESRRPPGRRRGRYPHMRCPARAPSVGTAMTGFRPGINPPSTHRAGSVVAGSAYHDRVAGPAQPAEEIVMTTLPDRPNTALMVIDVQMGVVADVHQRDSVIANIGMLVDKA